MYSRHIPRAPTAGAELSASSIASVTTPTVKGAVQSVKKVNERKMHCPKIGKNWPWLDGAQTKNISKKGKHLKM